MLLVLGDDRVAAEHARALRREFQVASAETLESGNLESGKHLRPRGGFDAVIVDRTLEGPEATSRYRDLLDGADGRAAVVAVADAVPADVEADETITPPFETADLASAVRRAIRLREYRNAVDQLFEACRRDRTRESGQIRTVRDRADERLRALQTCRGRLPVERLIDA